MRPVRINHRTPTRTIMVTLAPTITKHPRPKTLPIVSSPDMPPVYRRSSNTYQRVCYVETPFRSVDTPTYTKGKCHTFFLGSFFLLSFGADNSVTPFSCVTQYTRRVDVSGVGEGRKKVARPLGNRKGFFNPSGIGKASRVLLSNQPASGAAARRFDIIHRAGINRRSVVGDHSPASAL